MAARPDGVDWDCHGTTCNLTLWPGRAEVPGILVESCWRTSYGGVFHHPTATLWATSLGLRSVYRQLCLAPAGGACMVLVWPRLWSSTVVALPWAGSLQCA